MILQLHSTRLTNTDFVGGTSIKAINHIYRSQNYPLATLTDSCKEANFIGFSDIFLIMSTFNVLVKFYELYLPKLLILPYGYLDI